MAGSNAIEVLLFNRTITHTRTHARSTQDQDSHPERWISGSHVIRDSIVFRPTSPTYARSLSIPLSNPTGTPACVCGRFVKLSLPPMTTELWRLPWVRDFNTENLACCCAGGKFVPWNGPRCSVFTFNDYFSKVQIEACWNGNLSLPWPAKWVRSAKMTQWLGEGADNDPNLRLEDSSLMMMMMMLLVWR